MENEIGLHTTTAFESSDNDDDDGGIVVQNSKLFFFYSPPFDKILQHLQNLLDYYNSDFRTLWRKKTSVANFGNKKDKQDNFMIKASDDLVNTTFRSQVRKTLFYW